MILAFTICSVNYLAQARTLGDSLRQTNPDWHFVIGLVDDLKTANLPGKIEAKNLRTGPEFQMEIRDNQIVPVF